ncbi:MAG: hypothetical protein CL942_06745 [Desulfovibrio sp.]|nr:hypothetical protein [Desulfovibrio sp.]|tara:strand:+ start:17496 stop:17954 length:459 start_codon:yes stop_codon:yes gene_type:complete
MRSYTFGHRFGEKVVHQEMLNEIYGVIASVTIKPANSQARPIKAAVLGGLKNAGWSDPVALSVHSGITITSIKDEVGLCLQTGGNMARGYADLIKLQTLYQRETISSGIILMPTKIAADALGSNIVNYDRFKREMEIYERTITMPLVIIGWE